MQLRSGKYKTTNMSANEETLKNLASKDDIESLKILLTEQNLLIRSLRDKLEHLESVALQNASVIKTLEERVDILEGDIKYLRNQDQLKDRKIDDQEQYSRRQCLRIKGFEVNENESTKDCEKIVKDYIKNLKVDIEDREYDRIHRIGKIQNNNGKSVQSIIVKFKGFQSRTDVYRARSKNKDSKVKIRLDLTHRRSVLLEKAYAKTEGNVKVKFVFADINCSLCVHTSDGQWKYFNSMDEFERIICKLSGP